MLSGVWENVGQAFVESFQLLQIQSQTCPNLGIFGQTGQPESGELDSITFWRRSNLFSRRQPQVVIVWVRQAKLIAYPQVGGIRCFLQKLWHIEGVRGRPPEVTLVSRGRICGCDCWRWWQVTRDTWNMTCDWQHTLFSPFCLIFFGTFATLYTLW